MSRYTLIGPDPKTMGQITESLTSPPTPPPPVKKPFKWLPIVDDAQTFDPWQQVRTCSYTIYSDHVQETCVIREMTQTELTTARNFNATRFDEVWLQITFDHENRIRAMEKKQLPLTMQQWQDNIKAILKGQ